MLTNIFIICFEHVKELVMVATIDNYLFRLLKYVLPIRRKEINGHDWKIQHRKILFKFIVK